ncbi:8-oxo-dGTP diphosphatase MutT [Aestuariibacter halophilus]|uniref:8-oxo-dGTP diphosphatase n=1 Tax=Fluctibacter halophilus TaxID=226011 RepID=A0ABS8G8N6_9ALTE|nr:8-oxo-dGTP diphosphatase MutT [Aestuariibacter halophilus]MCC2616461.1 8-oxo-dGTP diphosphatase MutT [Aestuariibacter halophilus]
MQRIEVAVGVILRDEKVFISRRADHLHQGGKWEFPGGKREADETFEQALCRELREEVGIDVETQRPLMQIRHDYPDKQVTLDVRTVTAFRGEPRQQEGQEALWVSVSDLHRYTFPKANLAIVNALQQR